MVSAWKKTQLGLSDNAHEAGFVLRNFRDGEDGVIPRVVELPFTNESSQISFYSETHPGNIALFHVHPSGNSLSQLDRQYAIDNNIVIYSFGRLGMYRWDPAVHNVPGGESGDLVTWFTDWTEPCF